MSKPVFYIIDAKKYRAMKELMKSSEVTFSVHEPCRPVEQVELEEVAFEFDSVEELDDGTIVYEGCRVKSD